MNIQHLSVDFPVSDIFHSAWETVIPTKVEAYWSGEFAAESRHFQARLLWSETSLYIRFDTAQDKPLVIADKPDLKTKSIGLWERDVCEIYIAPDRVEPRKYFEFEVAPTGEWLDLAIDLTSGERVVDWNYNSGMEAAALIEEGKATMAIKIPWKAFGEKPKAGDVWLGNIFRCVGKEPDRGYLAWRPTMTEIPNFHVPSAFGKFEFTDTSV